MNYCTRSLNSYQKDQTLINTSEVGSLNVTLFKGENQDKKDFYLVVDIKTSETCSYQWVDDAQTDLFVAQYIEGFLKTARRTLWEF